jgi:putative transposase
VAFADFNDDHGDPDDQRQDGADRGAAKADSGNFLRSLAETVLQILMEADVEGLIGAGRYERSGERATWRNGYRDQALDTRLGQLNLRISKLRTGSYFPSFREARRGPEKGYIHARSATWR